MLDVFGLANVISLFFKLCRKVPAKVVPAPVVSKSKLPAVPESLLKRRKKQKADRTKRLEQALAVSVKSCFRVRHILTGETFCFYSTLRLVAPDVLKSSNVLKNTSRNTGPRRGMKSGWPVKPRKQETSMCLLSLSWPLSSVFEGKSERSR